MSYIAPAGMPLGLLDLAAGLSGGLSGRASVRLLEERLAKLTGTDVCRTLSTGRAAMTTLLEAMKTAANDPRRTQVIVPAYTCYSVPAAVARAGLQPRLCDLDPATLDLDLDSLQRRDFSRVLAIISTSIYGIPHSLDVLERIAREKQVFLLDDAAQSLGATHAGRRVGGFGDAGILSFEKGKNITTLKGGALVARNSPLLRHIESRYASTPEAGLVATASLCVKLPIYSVCFHPGPYSVVRRIPGLGLGLTHYETDFAITRYSGLLAGLAARLCERVESLNAQRNVNARQIEAAVAGANGVTLLSRIPSSQPAHVRLPVFASSPARRAQMLRALDEAGIGASASYPQALCDVPELKPILGEADQHMPGARRVAESIVTLPTHPSCPPDLPSRIRQALDRA